MSDDMILMNPNYDTDRLKALEVLQRLRDERDRMGIKLEEITVAIDRVLREHRVAKDTRLFRDLTIDELHELLDAGRLDAPPVQPSAPDEANN